MQRIFFVFFLLISVSSFGQPGNLFIRNFPPSEYQSENYSAGPQNFDVIEDKRGMLYVANPNTILEFDGFNWRSVNNSILLGQYCRSLAADSKGRIYLGSKNELGYLATDSAGLMTFVSVRKSLNASSITINRTLCLNDTVYFVGDSAIYIYDNQRFTTVNAGQQIAWAQKEDEEILAYLPPHGLYHFVQNKLMLIPGTEVISNAIPIGVYFNHEGEEKYNSAFVIGVKGLYHWNMNSPHALTSVSKNISDAECAAKLSDHVFAIGTASHGLYLVSDSGKIIKQLTKKEGLADNTIFSIHPDSVNGLWLSLSTGLSRVEYPLTLTYFNDQNNLSGIVWCSIRYQNTFYVGMFSHGLFRQPTPSSEKFIKEESTGSVWKFLPVENGQQLLIATDGGIYLQKGTHRTLITTDMAYNLCQSTEFPEYVFASHYTGLGILHNENGTWKYMGKLKNFGDNESRSMTSGAKGQLFASSNKIFKIDFSKGVSLDAPVTEIKVQKPHNEDAAWPLFFYQNQIMCGSNYEGIYHYDELQGLFVKDSIMNQLIHGKKEVASPYVDNDNTLWFANNFHVSRLIQDNNHFELDTASFMLMPRTGIWSFYHEGNITWISTTDGLFRFDNSVSKKIKHSFTTLVRLVVNERDTLFRGTQFDENGLATTIQNNLFKINIPFHKNSILFECSATDYSSKEKIAFSYWLEGLDKRWSDWQVDTKKEYVHLHEGQYVFHVKAKNIYGVESRDATYKFTILPPWFRTWWAYLIYLLVAFLLVRGIIQLNQYRLINEKKILAKKVIQRTEQISKQKQIIETEKDKVEKKSLELQEALTTLKRTQNQLLLSEKLASVGQLTAGVAHEINNPINFVTANISPLKKNFESLKVLLQKIGALKNDTDLSQRLIEIEAIKKSIDFEYTIDESEKLLSGIEEGSRRTAAIVKGLRQFSRMDEDVKKKANINEGIESTLVLLQNKMKFQNIEVELSLGKIPDISCYPGQLNQVFMNLFTNAIDAIGSNGKIFISTSADEKNVKVSVRDTGPGMSEEVKQKIFDPFFSTKDVGKGTGLGLSISYGIIEKHNGTIEVKSEIGKGTEFIILLPV